jgi:hypothetical protein
MKTKIKIEKRELVINNKPGIPLYTINLKDSVGVERNIRLCKEHALLLKEALNKYEF